MRLRHAYDQPATSAKFTVPDDGHARRITVAWFPLEGQSSCTGGTAELRIQKPDGASYATLYAAVLDTTGAACGDPLRKDETLPPGAWTISFDGSGAVRAWIDVVKS